MKGELEDLSFKVLEPEIFQLTKYTQIAANKAYHDAAERVQELISTDKVLKNENFSFRLSCRIKDKYQLYLKMKRKHLKKPNDVRDALGLRIIVEPRNPKRGVAGESISSEQALLLQEEMEMKGQSICYYLVERLRNMVMNYSNTSWLHSLISFLPHLQPGWEPSKNGFKDYILGAKENGYQSLHQYIRHIALATNVEVQVRTKAMHIKAELGEAAHWFYKDTLYRREIADSKIYRIAWRSPQQMKAQSPAELIGMAKQQIQAARVLIYLEDNSTVMNLKKGSTALDAAFAVHSDVGLSAVTIRLNGVPVPFGRTLSSGDVVSVDCAAVSSKVSGSTNSSSSSSSSEEREASSRSRVITAKLSWLKMVQTTQAQATLRKHLRESQRGMLVILGLVQLLAAVARNKQLLVNTYTTAAQYSGTLSRTKNYCPDAHLLAQKVRERTALDLLDYFTLLGTASTSQETAAALSRLLAVPAKRLIVSSVNDSIQWARSQAEWGWKDADIRNDILRPFLLDILPKEGVSNARALWTEVVGSESLSEVTPLSPGYYGSIAHSLFGKLRIGNSSNSVASSLPSPLSILEKDGTADFLQESVEPHNDSDSDGASLMEPMVPFSCAIRSPSRLMTALRNGNADVVPSGRSRIAESEISRGQTERKFIPKIYVKSQIEIAQRPFSLEASSLSQPLRALARRQYADQAMARSTSEYSPAPAPSHHQ